MKYVMYISTDVTCMDIEIHKAQLDPMKMVQ